MTGVQTCALPICDGVTRVSVSEDGAHFYALDPLFAANVEDTFPTDGAGNFRQPVDPSLRFSDFAGLTLDGIRRLYAGSGGGTAFDIGWARDSAGLPVVPSRRWGDDSVVGALSALGLGPALPVHLLDPEASGLVVLSGSPEAAASLRWNWRSRRSSRSPTAARS